MLSLSQLRDARPILNILKFSIILCCLGWALSYSLAEGLHLPADHLDGAFQTASGLYRLDAGHAPGKNFYPYLGVGPLFLLFPFFKALGANLFASVAATQLMVFIVVGVSTALTWHFVWRPRSFLTSLVVGSLFVPLSFAILNALSLPLPDWLGHMVLPGNSLRPLRAAAPYIVAGIYFFIILNIQRPITKAVSAGIMTGAILLWSNDFAVPTAGLFAVLFLAAARVRDGFGISIALYYIVVAALSGAFFVYVLSFGHPVKLLTYNFVDVRRDQWWYFAPYYEQGRIFRFADITKLVASRTTESLLLLVIVFIIAIITRLIEHFVLAWIGTVLLFGGLIPSVGGHIGNYFIGFHFWGITTLGIGCMYLLWIKVKNVYSGMPHLVRMPWACTAIFFSLLLSICFLAVSLNELRAKTLNAHNDPARFFVPELGGYLNQEWEDYIRLARGSGATNIIEEYWGIWSATRRTFPKWPVDSAIHALGGTRKDAAEALKGADLIITTKHSYSMAWQSWNISQNYWLYQPLLIEWIPSTSSPTTVVWERRDVPLVLEEVGCRVDRNRGPSATLDAAQPGFYQVSMRYSVSGRGRVLTLIRNNISFAYDADGYVSFDPQGTRASFPVYRDAPGPVTLDAKTVGPSDRALTIESCTAKALPAISQEVLPVPGTVGDGFFLTDANWIRGIARHWPGFFVPNTERFGEKYQPGRVVEFVDGTLREITRTAAFGPYLNVYLVGTNLLDPEEVGLPSEFIVVDKADQDVNQHDH